MTSEFPRVDVIKKYVEIIIYKQKSDFFKYKLAICYDLLIGFCRNCYAFKIKAGKF